MPTPILRTCVAAIVWLSLAGTLCGLSQPSQANPSSTMVKIRASQCTPLTTQQREWLGPEWQRFLPFVRSCEVTWRKSAPLYVLSIWAEDFEATLPKDAPAERLPKPIIAANDGKVLGRLPIGFPLDPPRTTDVSFTKWLDGFPHRICIAVTDPTVLGNHSLVLTWSSQEHLFIGKSK